MCHNHLVVAVDKSTMNNNSEKFIQDLICTSVLELIKKYVDVKILIKNGLLKPIDNIPEINDQAEKILKHKSDERCKIIIGPSNSDKKFQYRKLHAVRNSSYPTRHLYIPIK